MHHKRWHWSVIFALFASVACSSTPSSPPDPRASAHVANATKRQAAPSPAVKLLADAIGSRKLALLGEIHGTQEIPALVGDLLELESSRGKPVILALEITSQDQAKVDRYLASPGSADDRVALLSGAHWRDPMHDGRDSAAMFELIEHMRSLRTRGRDIAILLFDPGNVEDRNRGMADDLRSAALRAPDASVIVLTGNVHAMTRRPPRQMLDASGTPIEPPMSAGRYLADLHPLSVDIEAITGEAWNCAGPCGVHPVHTREPGRLAPVLDHQDPSDSAWDAVLLVPRFSASRPAIEVMP